MSFRRLTLLGIFLLPTFSRAAGSFNLAPWILIFEPQAKVISQVVTFRYQGDNEQQPPGMGPAPKNAQISPIPVEISVSARELTLDGTVIYPSSAGADDFVVYPSQFILYPGDTKKVQVQWVGSRLPDKEISLGFIATQVPLNIAPPTEKPKTAITRVEMVTRYEGIIVVRPPNIRPNVVVDTAYARKDTTGSTRLVMILNNKGTGMQSLKNLNYALTPLDKNGKLRLPERVQKVNTTASNATNQSLLAGFRRKVDIPWPTEVPVGPVNATVTFPDAAK
jgi:fimbrial chaperone protein